MESPKDTVKKFTHLESKVLKLIAEYYSEQETAEKLKLDLQTVSDIKTNVMKTYELKSCIELRRFLKANL
jgi:DNA-binding NarL/FixJ family response regulator